MSDKYQELKINTILLAVSNIGTKAISFILAPLYSFYLSTEQYGAMDLMTVTVALIMPFICLDIFEATFRYASDPDYVPRKVFNSSLAVCISGMILFFPAFAGACVYAENVNYIVFTYIYSMMDAVNSVMAQYVRGQYQMRRYVASGIINSMVVLLSNIILLVLMHMQLTGWMISFAFGKVAVLLYFCITLWRENAFSIECVDYQYIKQFLRFSLPLMPTATMWWIMNASDRYLISFFIGSSAIGIYSVANKVPAILSVLVNVFYQSWQTTAIHVINDEDRDSIYSNIFNYYIVFICIGVMVILLIGKPLIFLLFESSYNSAWICMSPLIVAVMIHALNGNLGSLYSVFKDTGGALRSTILGAMTNFILNLIAIPFCGILGAAIATLVGYSATLLYRWFDIKRFVHIKLNVKRIFFPIVSLFVQWVFYYISGYTSYMLRFFLLLIVIWQYRVLLLAILRRKQ